MTTTSPSAALPYLRSCKQECDKPINGNVKGEVPKWLKGCLIRVGSGLLEVGPDKYNHLFDGLALMHRFSFNDGIVTYQNRFLRSDAYRKNMKANRIVVSEFATRGIPDPCKTIFQRFASFFSLDDATDNDLVNILLFSGEAYAATETNNIWKIDPETLEAQKKVNMRKYAEINAMIAHSHEDKNGTVYNMGCSLGSSSSYCILKFPPKKKEDSDPFQNTSIVCRIPSCKSYQICYYHSFGMTENYFVFVEQPLFVSVPRLAWSHFVAGVYGDALRWDGDALVRFHVIQRSDGKLLDTVYVTKSFFVFHHINAYEEDNHIVVDMCCYDQGDAIKTLYIKALEELVTNTKKPSEPFVSKAKRYVLPLNIKDNAKEDQNLVTLANSEATAHRQPNGNIFCNAEILTGTEPWSPELPRINYDFNGKKYKYFYAVARNETLRRTHLIKGDASSKTTISWSEEGAIPSEPVYMANPNSSDQEEDSGVILASLLYHEDESKVSMLVLDAKTMTEIARVTFAAPSSVPGDFHGTFIAK